MKKVTHVCYAFAKHVRLAQIGDFLSQEILKEVNVEFEQSLEENELWEGEISYLQWKTSDKQTELVTQVAKRADVVRFAAEKFNMSIFG